MTGPAWRPGAAQNLAIPLCSPVAVRTAGSPRTVFSALRWAACSGSVFPYTSSPGQSASGLRRTGHAILCPQVVNHELGCLFSEGDLIAGHRTAAVDNQGKVQRYATGSNRGFGAPDSQYWFSDKKVEWIVLIVSLVY
jgi:hypothetical protein